MAAESTRLYKQLEEQAHNLISLFEQNGYEIVAPTIIQPAGIFLDHIGESLRARTFVFRDPDGQELCLRPDLTMPVCRLHLERMKTKESHDGIAGAYCYNGSAFRYQPGGETEDSPREFRQAGAENFGDNNREDADAQMLALAVKTMQKAGLQNYSIRIGDLGLFDALLQAIPMPAHWRTRLRHHFWRHDSFHSVLDLISGRANREIQEIRRKLLLKLDPEHPEDARETVAGFLKGSQIPLIGVRTLDEITERLLEQAADMQEKPLAPEMVQMITDYLNIEAKPTVAMTRIRDLAEQNNLDFSSALDRFERRLDYLEKLGISSRSLVFSAEYGRDLEYYTGFVFQIELPAPENIKASQLAGGGRYDSLFSALGANTAIPAVGFAIHTDRLLKAVLKERDAA